jgi:hypothetical protein
MSAPLVTNAADREQLRHARRKEQQSAQRGEDDLAHLLADPAFRRWLYAEVLERQHMFRSVFATDPLTMAYQAGQQDVAHRVAAHIEGAKPGALFLLMQEAATQRERDALEALALRTGATRSSEETNE